MRALVVLPNLRAVRRPGGHVVLTQKFIDGMAEYCRYWDGPVRVIIEPADQLSVNLDNVEVATADLPFETNVMEYDDGRFRELIADCAVGYGGVDHRQNDMSRVFAELRLPFVYGSEYTLKTRLQILRAEVRNPLLLTRRAVWQVQQERRQRASIKLARGIQCNGTPTFDAYRDLTPSPFLFFDTRMTTSMQVGREELESRLAEAMDPRRPLRLAFSGRLAAMKGAEQTIEVARALRDAGVPFDFTICGGGPLETTIRGKIDAYGLRDRVKLMGVLEFKTELVPFIRRSVDLFVCCHPQGDPSCTYVETLACGVPIAGYANEAFTGILTRADVGTATPVNRPLLLAHRIGELARDRSRLAELSRNAIDFAAGHDFESAFKRRVEHFRAAAGANGRG